MAFEYYINHGVKKLRCGYTTGSCATLASKAAFRMILSQEIVKNENIITPKGLPVSVNILDAKIDDNFASATVLKDAGDDIDATDKAEIVAKVTAYKSENDDGLEIIIDGGLGVGRVTKPGLTQDIGQAAINPTPKRTIKEEIERLAEEFNFSGRVEVIIEVPKGLEIAKKTFNEKIGIVGGISIIGTTGVVEPLSLSALIATIDLEIKSISASGIKSIIACPGNYGEKYTKEKLGLGDMRILMYSNFVGEMLDFLSVSDIEEVLIVSHIGKGVKLGGNIMNTHSKYADCRMEIIAAYSALSGVNFESIEKIMACISTDAALEILEKEGKIGEVMEKIIKSAQEHLSYRVAENTKVGILMFSNVYGLLGMSDEARELLKKYENN